MPLRLAYIFQGTKASGKRPNNRSFDLIIGHLCTESAMFKEDASGSIGDNRRPQFGDFFSIWGI